MFFLIYVCGGRVAAEPWGVALKLWSLASFLIFADQCKGYGSAARRRGTVAATWLREDCRRLILESKVGNV